MHKIEKFHCAGLSGFIFAIVFIKVYKIDLCDKRKNKILFRSSLQPEVYIQYWGARDVFRQKSIFRTNLVLEKMTRGQVQAISCMSSPSEEFEEFSMHHIFPINLRARLNAGSNLLTLN